MAKRNLKNIESDTRKRLSIDLCDNFVKKLNPEQPKVAKIGALVAIRNYLKNSNIEDQILASFLVDSITDPDKDIKDLVSRIIKEVKNKDTEELLQIKLKEVDDEETKKEIEKLL